MPNLYTNESSLGLLLTQLQDELDYNSTDMANTMAVPRHTYISMRSGVISVPSIRDIRTMLLRLAAEVSDKDDNLSNKAIAFGYVSKLEQKEADILKLMLVKDNYLKQDVSTILFGDTIPEDIIPAMIDVLTPEKWLEDDEGEEI